MKKQLLTGALAATTLIVTSVIQVAPAQALTFNFADSPASVSPSFNFSEGGIDVTATGQSTAGTRNVFQGRWGLGVTIKKSWKDGDSNQIDGLGRDETLNLNFSEQVNLVSATFGRVGFYDEFRLLVDGNQFIDANIPGGNRFDRDVGVFSFSPSPTGSLFGFTVTDKNDDYYLKSIHVKPVPTPAAVLPGLFGMGMAALRKKHEKIKAS